jgi:DNA-binding MarR family transcriptional regulator
MAKLDAKKQETQVKVLAALQTLGHQWQEMSAITYHTKLSKPSAVAALTLLIDKGYVERKEFYRGLAPYRERVTKYITTPIGQAVTL